MSFFFIGQQGESISMDLIVEWFIDILGGLNLCNCICKLEDYKNRFVNGNINADSY